MKIKITESNFEKQYFMSLESEMRQLATPLHAIGIVHFSHIRIWSDQSISALTTHPSYDMLFMRERFYENTFAGNPEEYQTGIAFYDDLYITSENVTTLQDIKNSCIQHASFTPDLMVINKLEDHVDLYWFGTPHTFTNTHTFYLNNLDYIKRFLTQFHINAAKLLKKTYQNQLIYPTQGKELSCLSSPEWNSQVNQQYMDKSNICSFNTCRYQLTKQETVVADSLIQGKTPKQISHDLNISGRTTEKHIAHLKEKTESRSLIHLISILNKMKNN